MTARTFLPRFSVKALPVILLAAAAWTVPAAAQSVHDVADSLDLLPTPRQITLFGGEHTLDGWEIVTSADTALATVGAEEINDRLAALGADPLPVVDEPTGKPALFVGRWWDPPIRPLAMALNATLTPEDPGAQGYVIRFGTYNDRPVVLLGGSDALGMLYACVTFRRLMQQRGDAAVALEARVRDRPDFKIRSNGMLDFDVLRQTEATPDDLAPLRAAAASLKRQVDFHLRHKVNYLRARHPFFSTAEPGDALHEQKRRLMQEVLAYAQRRGIQTRLGGRVEVKTYLTPEQRAVAVEREPGSRYLWAAFEAHRQHAKEYARLMRGAQIDVFSLHPLDNGFYPDPEKWSQRSPQTKAMYGDDRKRAELEQFMLYFNTVRQRNPQITLEAVAYPYHYQFARPDFVAQYDTLKWGMPNVGKFDFIEDAAHARQVRKRMTNFHRYLAEGLPDDVYIVFREASRATFEATAALYDEHPLTIWIYPDRNRGWHGTFVPQVRYAKTFWRPDRRDYYYVASAGTAWSWFNDGRPKQLAQQEYLWNVNRPDASDDFTLFSRFYKHEGRHVTEFQRAHLIPRISRILYGDQAAPAHTQAVEENVSLHYVIESEEVGRVAWAAEYFDDPYQYMDEQAAAFERIHAAMAPLVEQDALATLPDALTKAWTVFHYRYAGLAALKAQLDAAAARARRLAEDGQPEAAKQLVQETLDGLPALQQQADQIRARSDTTWQDVAAVYAFAPPYKAGRLDVLDTFQPADFEDALEDALTATR